MKSQLASDTFSLPCQTLRSGLLTDSTEAHEISKRKRILHCKRSERAGSTVSAGLQATHPHGKWKTPKKNKRNITNTLVNLSSSIIKNKIAALHSQCAAHKGMPKQTEKAAVAAGTTDSAVILPAAK